MSDEDTENIPDVIARALSAELKTDVTVQVEFPVPGGPGIVIVRDRRSGREIDVATGTIAGIVQQHRLRPPTRRSVADPNHSLTPAQRALAAFDAAQTDDDKLSAVLDYLALR